jgi:hypothetical protein
MISRAIALKIAVFCESYAQVASIIYRESFTEGENKFPRPLRGRGGF